jgi:hypothetical protein
MTEVAPLSQLSTFAQQMTNLNRKYAAAALAQLWVMLGK